MTLRVSTNLLSDIDAIRYISRVIEADGQILEYPVQLAINNFVVGCKSAGIWNAIKSCCILAGARTLQGALIPLVGAAPTNFNFVAGDYNRKTGLLGDGATKYLNTNRSNSEDPQDSKHIAVYTSTSIGVNRALIGSLIRTPALSVTQIFYLLTGSVSATVNGNTSIEVPIGNPIGFFGVARNSANSQQLQINAANTPSAIASNGNHNQNIMVFARNDAGTVNQHANCRIRAYSIGEFADLAILRSLQDQLFTTFNAVIP